MDTEWRWRVQAQLPLHASPWGTKEGVGSCAGAPCHGQQRQVWEGAYLYSGAVASRGRYGAARRRAAPCSAHASYIDASYYAWMVEWQMGALGRSPPTGPHRNQCGPVCVREDWKPGQGMWCVRGPQWGNTGTMERYRRRSREAAEAGSGKRERILPP